MKRIINACIADIKFQFNQGFYVIYLILAAIYITIIYQTGYRTTVILIPVLIYFDPAMAGFMFTGGLVMLERQQGITGYIGITPLKTWEYMAAKVLSMTSLAFFASLIICISVWKPFNALILTSGIMLVSVFHSVLGLMVSSKCRSMNDYFIRMIPYLIAIILPAAGFIDSGWTIIFRFLPGFAGLRLILSAFANGIESHIFQDAAVMVVWIAIIAVPAKEIFDRNMIKG